MNVRVTMAVCLLASVAKGPAEAPANPGDPFAGAFINFETAPVHPLALSPEHSRLAVCNLADGKLEVFDVTSGRPVLLGTVAVGLDPVSVRFRNAGEAWVVNHISDSISVVDLATLRVQATINTLDTPEDVVFAGVPGAQPRAFVSCARPNTIQVFDPSTWQAVTNIVLEAERPRALAVSPDGRKVYAAIFESGNGTTVVGGKFRNLLFFDNALSRTNGPYGGQNPAPNSGTGFQPPLNPDLPGDVPAPPSGIVVRKNAAGRWLDGNKGDWTEFVSGTNASLTQRVPGWDLPDRDLAAIDPADFSVTYATGLMNICMALEVNPASGRIAVVGTDAINEVRFEPNLNGVFVRVKLAWVDPASLFKTVQDLNPHLDYMTAQAPPTDRDWSIGDPRSIVWSADGTRGYVAGMGSRNLVLLDSTGQRLPVPPLEVGEGPCGLALDEARQRLYVFNRFSSSLAVVDTTSRTVVDTLSLFDPTPPAVAAGRIHLYDTRRTSGLGQASCASCHVDARLDRLGWDLGNPAAELSWQNINMQGRMMTNAYHPMKGLMMTQTLQDIIGHEPFHWRGDRPDIESFNTTFTNLQGAATALTRAEMGELRAFLASIRLPPNPYRPLDNSLSTNLPLPGHVALGEDVLPAGAPLPNGNAAAGLRLFNDPANFCVTCHTTPTGLGLDSVLQAGALQAAPAGTNGEHHLPLATRLEGSLPSKIAQFRNLTDKIGMATVQTQSRAGFGFGHDGSVDSLTRFLNGVRIHQDQDVADLIAFLLSTAGSDTRLPGAPEDATPPASVGRQLTLASAMRPGLFDDMLGLARSPASRVELMAKGTMEGLPRGWLFDAATDRFQSDRRRESFSVDELLALAGPGHAVTFTVVPRGLGQRLGIDRDLDGILDRDELDAGSNPADPPRPVRVLPGSAEAALGSDFQFDIVMAPLPAPATALSWLKDGQPLAGETNSTLFLRPVPFSAGGEYAFVVTTRFQTFTSAPVRMTVLPLLVSAAPLVQAVRAGSNALLTAAISGLGPFAYQWQFNGEPLPNATTSTLTVTNVGLAQEGYYRVIAANSFGSVTSPPVRVGVLINPSVLVPPLNQRAVAGGNATFSLTIAGHPPPFGYLLRKSSAVLTNYASDEHNAFLTLFQVQPGNAGTYRIIITNAANPSPGLSLDPVTLTVLDDSDHDGLPDEWEIAHLLDPNDPSDAAGDADQDGMTNAQEYLAGTDPRDPQSFLKIERLALPGGSADVAILFRAAADRTYTLQSRQSLATGDWKRLADVVAFPNDRLVTITNRTEGTNAVYYRLVTPYAP